MHVSRRAEFIEVVSCSRRPRDPYRYRRHPCRSDDVAVQRIVSPGIRSAEPTLMALISRQVECGVPPCYQPIPRLCRGIGPRIDTQVLIHTPTASRSTERCSLLLETPTGYQSATLSATARGLPDAPKGRPHNGTPITKRLQRSSRSRCSRMESDRARTR